MKRFYWITLVLMMFTMCSSGAEWQDVIDNAHSNPSSPSKPQEPSDSDDPADPAEKDVLTIGVFTDSHYSATKEPSNDRHYKKSRQKIADAVATFNEVAVDMTVSLGDIVDNEFEDYDDIAQSLNALTMPFHQILGNHDFVTPFSDDLQAAALITLNIENRYFSIEKYGFRLIFLDGSDIAKYSNSVGSAGYREAESIFDNLKDDGEVNARQYNGAIGKKQQEWLKAQLTDATEKSQTVVCFCHIPFAVDGAGKYTLWNREDMIEMLEEFGCVKALIAGHHHEGGYADDGGFHHITLKGMVVGESTTSYSVIKIHKDQIEIDGYGREEDRKYNFR